MNIQITSLTMQQALALLQKADLQFTPPLFLSQNIDIQSYATKLSKYAKFALLNTDTDIKSSVAFYHNYQEKFIYIPFVWTDKNCRKKGFSKFLLDAVHEFGISHGCKISRLEVRKDNHGALSLYTKLGYTIEEDRGEKYLMTKQLGNP